MAPRLSPERALRIRESLNEQGSRADLIFCQQLASNFNTTLRTIQYHKAAIAAGEPSNQYSGGPRRVVTLQMEQAIKLLLDERPWYYQDEIADFLLDAFGVEIRRQTVSYILKRIKVSRKKLRVVAAQQNEELRVQWRDSLQNYTADQLVFLDESGSDNRTGDRKYGWAEVGARAVVRRWLGSRKRVSVLPAYTLDGYIAARTFLGTSSAELFGESVPFNHINTS